MDRKLTVIFALATAPSLAFAQARVVLPPVPGGPILPIVAPVLNLTPTLTTLQVAPGGILTPAAPLTLAPAAGLRLAPAAGIVTAVGGPAGLATGGQAKEKVTARGNLQALATSVAPKGRAAGSSKVMDGLRIGFDAGRAAEPGSVSFGGDIDPRIARAVGAMAGSAVGLSIYQEVYNKHAATLRLETDTAWNANYDARLVWRGNAPVIQVTETLLNRESDAFIASKIAKAMAEVYYKDFPASAEREYLVHAAMIQTFADLTGSGTGNRWDDRSDRWKDGRSETQAHYASWKESLQLKNDRGQDIQNSTYFRWIGGQNGQMSLWDQLRLGRISRSAYNQMSSYFNSVTRSETDWLRNTGRWWSNP